MKLCVVPCGQREVWNVNPNAGPPKRKTFTSAPLQKRAFNTLRSFIRRATLFSQPSMTFSSEEIIPEDYNVTFNDLRTNPISVDELRRQAEKKGLMKYDEIVVVAGSKYANIVKSVFVGKRVRAPLAGLGGMGPMISAMKKAIKEGKEL